MSAFTSGLFRYKTMDTERRIGYVDILKEMSDIKVSIERAKGSIDLVSESNKVVKESTEKIFNRMKEMDKETRDKMDIHSDLISNCYSRQGMMMKVMGFILAAISAAIAKLLFFTGGK